MCHSSDVVRLTRNPPARSYPASAAQPNVSSPTQRIMSALLFSCNYPHSPRPIHVSSYVAKEITGKYH